MQTEHVKRLVNQSYYWHRTRTYILLALSLAYLHSHFTSTYISLKLLELRHLRLHSSDGREAFDQGKRESRRSWYR